MQYMMFFFISSSSGRVDPEHQWHIGTAVMGLVAFVFLVNVITIIYLTVMRIIFWCKVRKARQAFLKARVRRNAMKRLPTAENALNDARQLSLIAEEVGESLEIESSEHSG